MPCAKSPSRKPEIPNAVARSLNRCEGKPPPRHVLNAAHAARRGSHHTEEARRKNSEALRRRDALVPGTVPWTAEEDELVRTLPAEEVVRRTGRSLIAVYTRRSRLRVPDGRRWK
jgi:hypothetical protein